MTQHALEERMLVSPYDELIALESLYAMPGASLRKVTAATVNSSKLPTEVVAEQDGLFPRAGGNEEIIQLVDNKIGEFSVTVNGTPGWPEKLADSEHPTPLLYYRGDLGLIESTSVSVVGSRNATAEGASRARRVARELVQAGVTVTTGLARGIDTEASRSALESGGRVIGVIGTPIDEVYPPENAELQELVAQAHLLISQVSFWQYFTEPFKAHRYHFPERNELMAAISDATIIVEASDTSGTLTQARACLHQGRPLFIMRSLLNNEGVLWPKKFVDKPGVHILDDTQQVLDVIEGRNE